MMPQKVLSPATGAQAARGIILLACALLLPCLAAAQTGPTVTIRILDGKTGEPIRPANLIVRVDHREEPFNEGLKMNGDDPTTATLPPNATLLSIQGTYNASMDIYVNCDADAGKDKTILKWYSIADILKSGMVTPNLCYKGKFQNAFKIVAKPGEFVFFVRASGWQDVIH
ncbi:MAG: hypothetical protein ABR928_00175 [Terracidiphilus sp.]|jgi:hypothetical protein